MSRPAKTRAAVVAEQPSPSPYLGQHLRVVDNGRVILPVEWRRSAKEFIVLLWPLLAPEYLLVLSPSRWEVMQSNLESLSLTDDDAATVERLIGASSSSRAVDSYGRLPLPEEAIRGLGIEGEAMLIGRLNKFELWNPARYAAKLATPVTQAVVANALRSIKI
jgi:MraZ protein